MCSVRDAAKPANRRRPYNACVCVCVRLAGSTAVAEKAVKPKTTPALDSMNFILMTRTANYSIPLRAANRLWQHEHFNSSRPTVVMVTGWLSNINKTNKAVDWVYAAYMCRGGYNLVVSAAAVCRRAYGTCICQRIAKRAWCANPLIEPSIIASIYMVIGCRRPIVRWTCKHAIKLSFAIRHRQPVRWVCRRLINIRSVRLVRFAGHR